MRAESNDPIFTFSTWHNLSSPYGPLFTALTYPLAFLSIPIAYWVLKVAIIMVAVGFVWTVAHCARLLGRDERFAVLFIVANPVFVFYAIGGFHNDFLMLLPSTASIALLLHRRDRLAGAVLMLAVAVKLTAIVLLPFLLIAAKPPERRLRVIQGCVIAGVPLIAMSLALFGLSIPNLSEQSSVVTDFSIPNLTGILVGLGGSTTGIVRLLSLVLVIVVLWGLRQRDWIGAAGWATVALIASVSWLMPWYVVWLLPLAAIAGGRALRRTAIVLTVFLVVTFLPSTGPFLSDHGIKPMGSARDQAALALQRRLQGT
jgi:alpha-1,6-mannosyltransferase